MSNNKSILRVILDLITAIFEGYQKDSRPRTWHQHVVPYKGDWAVRREGNKRVSSKHRKQSTAIRRAKTAARKRGADVIIHRADGTIRDRISFED